jgi:hypothetical protein
MNSLKVPSKAELARKKLFDLRQALSTRSGTPPEVENLLPALPGDDVRKLQAARQGTDCKVIITDMIVPPGSVAGETFVALQKDGVVVTGWEQVPIPVPTVFNMNLPAKETATPGPFRLTYIVDYGGNLNKSDVYEFFIDTVAPNHGAPGGVAVPPAEIVDGVLTREILDALGNITMQVPTPDDVKQGDIYTAYYGKSDPAIPVDTFIVDMDSTSPIELVIPKANIEAWGEGPFIFYCKFADRVGNVGPSSEPFQFDVRLTPAPSGLQPPEIPENDDGVVDLKDAFPDVAVVIPTFSGGQPNDVARVTFNGKVQPDKPTDGTTEVIVDVPFRDVADGGDGPKDVRVTYAIMRNNNPFPETTGADIHVDLKIPGPPNPEPDPDKGNPNLVALVVKGSTADDTLVEDDVGNSIDIDLTIPDITTLKAGDIFDLLYDGNIVPPPDGRYTVDGNEPAGFKIPFKLPSDVFVAAKNGIKIARYIITNPANGSNANPSLPTPVDAYVIPVTLPDPVIQYLYTNPANIVYLNCSSIRDIPVVGKAAVVRVAGGGSLTANLKLDFVWKGTPLPGGDAIPDYPFSKTLQGNEHTTGFEVYLPFNAALRPIRDGRGIISYTAEIDGRTHNSKDHNVRVVVVDNAGTFCPGTQEA